ncbi:hypothetical protein JCGZ_19986 [Jatropha curcas]|uniref:Uncharacterized protein n=1 Tax=Jatropha curcas TaxID=180498 RepID=A0A067L9H1_JATCU|nr:hypothetical protein JCGZ_19986 [Jatropha curcas]
MLKVAWEKLCALRYADFTYRMQKSDKKQQCVSEEIWESWQKAWKDPAFKRKCDIFARNRCRKTGDDGAGPSRHTGGSISAIEISRLLMSQLVTFTFTDHGAGTSSSDPPPTIDRDVSIALHQPLAFPLDPDTVNNTLVTPADTMTHPADTPANAMTQDGVKDRPRRFDFGPF